MYLSELKKDYGGKTCVFNEERNKGKVGQDQSGRGREFQMDGAANEKERFSQSLIKRGNLLGREREERSAMHTLVTAAATSSRPANSI